MLLDILIEIVPVERTESAGAGFGVQPPLLQNVFVVVRPNQAHFHQRKLIDKHLIGIFLAAVLLLRAESHVQFVGLDILWPEALALFIAQQLPADKFCDQFHLIVDGAVPRHLGLVAVLHQRPPRDTDGAALSKIPQKVLIQRGVQNIKGNTGFITDTVNKLHLLLHPDRFQAQVTKNDRVINWNVRVQAGVGDGLLTSHQCQRCGLHSRPAGENLHFRPASRSNSAFGV